MAATRALHTFRLKRSKARESLGLVLISGPKTALGFTEYFLVKDVKPGTLAFKAGVHPGDRIVQIDNLDLTRLAPFEAVSRIKDKQVVIVTVERDTVVPLKGSSNHHIYDEVLYSDLLQHLSLSQDDPGFPQGGPMYSSRARGGRRGGGRLSEDGLLLSPGGHSRQNAPRPVSPLTRPSHQFQQQQQQQQQQKTQVTENSNSKDSGLSTGSSGSPRPTFRKQGGDGSGGGDKPSLQHSTQQSHQHSRREDGSPSPTPTPYYHQLDRGTGARHSYRTEREMLRGHLKDPRKAGQSSSHGQRPNHDHFFDGDYVIEEIYLAKDGTNQLGITLGYDTKTSKGQLIVCEVLPDGLAAIDGRIRSGDIIKKVNGFEVYDPEEAILLFLEQDQDITLTIARKHSNNVSSRRGSAKGRGRASAVSTDMRRVDSCGSLDSHSHQYHHLTNETDETLLVRCDGDGGGGRERPRELELELDLTPHEIDLPLLGVDGVEGEEETGEEAGGGGGGEYGGGGVFERQRQRAASTTIENTSPLLSPDFMRPRICSYSPPCGRKALRQFQGAPTADNSNDDTHYQHLHHHSHPQQQQLQQQQMQLQHLPRAHSSSLGSSSSSLSQNQQAQQPSQQQQLKQQQIQLQQHQQVPSSSVLRQHQQPQYQHLHYQHLQHHSAAPPTTTAFPANNNPSLSLSLSLSEQKHAVNTAAREKAHHLHHQQYLATRKQVQQLGHTAPAAAAVTGSGVVVVAPQHTMHGGSAASMATAATRAMRPSQTHSDLPRYVDHTYMYKQRSESLV